MSKLSIRGRPGARAAAGTGSRGGSTIVAVIMVVLVFGLILGAYMRVAIGEYAGSTDAYGYNALLNLNEAGAEEAIWALKNDDWTGWQSANNRKYRTLTGFDLGDGRVADIEVIVENVAANGDLLDEPLIYTAAASSNANLRPVQKQVRMELTYRSLFANGLTAIDDLVFSGGNATVDSYNSDDGAYHAFFNRGDQGTAGSISVQIDAVAIANASIFGFVATGQEQPDVGPNGRVFGADTPSGIKVDPNRVTTDFYAEFPDVEVPAIPGSAITSLPGGNNKVIGSGSTPGNPEFYHLSDLSLQGQKNLTIEGDVILVIDGDVDVKTSITLTNGATAIIYAGGDFTIGGNGIVNQDQVPEKMQIYGTAATSGGQEIKLHGNGAYAGVVYAPKGTLSLKGGGNSGAMFGAAVAYNISVNGNYDFHYDEALGDFFGDKPSFVLKSWRELVAAGDRINSFTAYFEGTSQ